MLFRFISLPGIAAVLVILGCCSSVPEVSLSPEELRHGAEAGIDRAESARLTRTPLYKFSKRDLDSYLRYLWIHESDLRARVVHLAWKCRGQPYEKYLLGEGDFELYDPQPLYSLEKSDCLSFCEHIYAMALSSNWSEFFRTLQRIRYKDGDIGILTRNLFTIPDWNVNNAWLVRDVTFDLIGRRAKRGRMICKRREFFSEYGIGQDIADQRVEFSYIGRRNVSTIIDKLEDGDFINVIKGNGAEQWCGHTGLIVHGSDGRPHMVHSSQTAEKVIEEDLILFLESNPTALGIKVLRLNVESLS